ncbi:MAG: hypothetical protein DAHOPDDO_03431 [Ignavibacteriaceae bacterium]|nr:hypothetical protein [Ignavibacteriaceae bacterium]
MKNFSFFFVLLFVAFLSTATMSQWVQQTAPGLPNFPQPQVIFSPIDGDDNVCWGKNSNNSQFLRTTDGGDNWTVSTVNGAAGLEGSSISAFDANTAWIAMNDPSNATSGGIFKTADGGSTWTKQITAFPLAGGRPNVIYFFDPNNGVCVGNPRGGYWEIYTTTNGGTNWIPVPSSNIPPPLAGELGIENSMVYSGATYFWFPTLRNRLYRTTDQGYTWTVADSVTGGPSQIGFGFAFKDDLNGLAADFYPNSVITKTTDGGETWVPIVPYPSGLDSISSLFIVYREINDSYVITSQTNLGGNQMQPGTAYSDTNVYTWTQVDHILLGPAAFSDCNTGWAGGMNNLIYKWVTDPSSCTIPVELISFNSSVIGNNIQLNWQTATEINNQGFEIYRNGNKIAFVEGKGTTTETQNYSFIDKNLQSGIYNYRLNQIDFDGTQEVVGELTVYLTLPEEFSLEQNYPNPFNPSTVISYQLPVTGFVSLKVYDVLGNEVAVLVNEEKPPGSYEVEFNSHSDEGQNLPAGRQGLSSGIYFYTLQAGSFTQTKKLILMK